MKGEPTVKNTVDRAETPSNLTGLTSGDACTESVEQNKEGDDMLNLSVDSLTWLVLKSSGMF